jgi:hypothetical protein
MEAKNVLDKMTEAIERVLKGAAPTTRKKRMTPEALLSYAVAQIEKAAKETPERAELRLRALGRTVEAAKQSFVDTESESIEVEVFEEETTAAAESSESETSPVAAGAALGSSAFAHNAEDLNKALAQVAKELESLRKGTDGARAPAGAKVQKGHAVDWPSDMNTREFREGVKKSEEKPAWGEDPEGVRAKGA